MRRSLHPAIVSGGILTQEFSGSVSIISGLIPAADLATLQAFFLSISNLYPSGQRHERGRSWHPHRDFYGTASASPIATTVREPSSLALLGSALLGFAWCAAAKTKICKKSDTPGPDRRAR